LKLAAIKNVRLRVFNDVGYSAQQGGWSGGLDDLTNEAGKKEAEY
jgi:hypothetical protein